MVKRAVTEAHRRSARISALEERARLRPKQNLASTSLSPPAASRKRGRKRKSLQAVVTNSVTNSPHQRGEHGKSAGTLENLSSPQPLPSKQALEFVLDVLQRRVTNEIFAQPVDAQEVVGYYNIIKEPMDFGTMRAKLQEGMYSSLNQFERDVFLISTNAMEFNPSNTVYYTEARDIGELAQRLFHTLRTQPENFQLEYTRTRRRPGRKPLGAASDSRARVPKSSSVNDSSLRRTNQLFLGPSHSNAYNGHNNNGSTSGPRDGGNLNSSETDRRMTYMPQTVSDKQNLISAVLNAPKILMKVPSAAAWYSDNLMQFVKDLGPTAKTIADKKLGKHPNEVPNNLSSTPAPFGITADCFPPNLSAFQNPARLNGGIGNQMPYNFLSKASPASKGKMVCTDEGTNSFRQDRVPNYNDFRGLRPDTTNNGITDQMPYNFLSKASPASKGKTVCTDEGTNSFRQDRVPNYKDFRGLRPDTTNNGITDQMPYNFLSKASPASKGKMVCTDEGTNSFRQERVPNYNDFRGLRQDTTNNGITDHNLRGEEGGNSSRKGHAFGSPQEKTNNCSDNMDLFIAALNQISNIQNGHNHAPSGEFYPLTGHVGLRPNPNPPPQNINRESFTWLLTHPEPPESLSLSSGSSSKAAVASNQNGGPNTAAPSVLNQNYVGNAAQQMRWKLPNGEGPSSAAPGALNQNYGAKPMQPLEWKLPSGEGPSSAPGYALDQNCGVKNMQQMGGWKLPNGEGPSSAPGYALDQNCGVKNMQQMGGWKLPNGEGPSSAPGYALDQNCGVKNMQQMGGWKLPNGEGPSSAPGYALDQNCGVKNMQQMGGWKLPNGEGPSSAPGYALDQNCGVKNMQQMGGWKLPNGEGPSSAPGYALDQNCGVKNMQQMGGWKLPNGEGPSSAPGYALDQNCGVKNMQQMGGWKLPNGEGPSSAPGYALDQNCGVKNMQQMGGWKLPNGEGPSSAPGYALDQNCGVKNMQQMGGWKLPNGEGPSSAPGYALDQNLAKNMQPMEWKLPIGEGSSSAAPFGMDQNNMAKAKQPAGWMLPSRLGLGPSTPVPSEQKFMASSIRAAQTAGWKQLNGQGMGSTSSAAALQQKYLEQSTQAAQTMEWKQPSSWSLPTMSNLSGVNGPVNWQITPMQQQLQEVPFNTMNFLVGGANSRAFQAQTNAQLLWNRQQSSVNGNKLPDLDLQL